MVYLSSTLFLSALLVNPAWSHMNMVTPPPRRGENNMNYPHGIDYDLASPLGYDKGYPCGGAPRGPPVATYRAGSSISIDVDGSATHDGGHCQFAISYDDCETFVVLKTIMSNCLTETGLHFEIPLPPNAPSSDHAVLSWSWINKTGNREYYMNCADIRVRGVEGGYIEGPELLVANLPGYPTIPEFTRGGYRGE
ncbi:putative endoglucanase precursor, partial [Conidiobolus coronatus NRRL 28638]